MRIKETRRRDWEQSQSSSTSTHCCSFDLFSFVVFLGGGWFKHWSHSLRNQRDQRESKNVMIFIFKVNPTRFRSCREIWQLIPPQKKIKGRAKDIKGFRKLQYPTYDREMRQRSSIKVYFVLFAVHVLFLFRQRWHHQIPVLSSSSALFWWLRFSRLEDPGILKTTCMAGFTSKHYKPAPYIYWFLKGILCILFVCFFSVLTSLLLPHPEPKKNLPAMSNICRQICLVGRTDHTRSWL